jgi:hypothetical protein
MSKVEKQWLFLQDVATLIRRAELMSITLTGGELYRTKEQQELHVKAGRSKTMNSKHMERLAIDFNFFIDGKLTYDHPRLAELGTFWETLRPGNRWGGFWKFKDTPHFEANEA